MKVVKRFAIREILWSGELVEVDVRADNHKRQKLSGLFNTFEEAEKALEDYVNIPDCTIIPFYNSVPD